MEESIYAARNIMLWISLPDDLFQGLEIDKATQVPTENIRMYKYIGSFHGIGKKILSREYTVLEY